MRHGSPAAGRHHPGRARRAARRAAILACALVALAWTASAGAAPSHRGHPRVQDAGYKTAPGPWGVRSIDRLVLHDGQRHKDVEITVRYPRIKDERDGASWPLVVFSHGLGGSRSAFPELTAHWASHGYVVVIPSHADALSPRGRRREPHRRFDVDELDRLADVELVLDRIDEIEQNMHGFHGRRPARVDRERIAIAGHSAGGLTAQMAIGVKVRVTAGEDETELKSVGDPRFKAAIVIAGQGTVNRMLTRESWKDLAKPLLVITGSRDVVPISRETPETRQEPFSLARPGQKYLVFIEGATHSSYAGRARGRAADGDAVSDADQRMITGVTASATLAFLDAFLDNDEHAREYLATDDLARLSGGKAELKRK